MKLMSNNRFILWRWWRYFKWRKSAGLTNSEMDIIIALLPSNDARSEQLLSQATDAPEVQRQLIGESGYRATIPFVKRESYLIEANNDLTSPPLLIAEIKSRRRLRFTLKILKGGFLNCLEGRVEDGLEWPMDWAPDPVELKDIRTQLTNWLPAALSDEERARSLGLLADWLGLNSTTLMSHSRQILEIGQPATKEDISLLERRLQLQLPEQYLQFVRICNGLSIRHGRPYEIYGTDDLYVHGMPNLDPAMVVVTNLYEDGLVMLVCNKAKGSLIYRLNPNTMSLEKIGDLRLHVKESLNWIEGISTNSD